MDIALFEVRLINLTYFNFHNTIFYFYYFLIYFLFLIFRKKACKVTTFFAHMQEFL